MSDRPIVWHPRVPNTSRWIGCFLNVYVVNNGIGPAEAVEVYVTVLDEPPAEVRG